MTFFGFSESAIRLTMLFAIFALMAMAEAVFPRKTRTQKRTRRWFTNWVIAFLDSITLRIVMPVLAVQMAAYAGQKGWGLFALTALPGWLETVAAIILLDMAVYGQHVATHKILILWRFHKMHHVDRDIDVTTGIRFHPVEIIFSMAYKLACVLVIGPSVLAVLLFEVTLNASAMFNHTNVKLPAALDKALRRVVVTPDMHRVHHSIIPYETNSNYGFFLSCWDRLFKTYIAQPKHGHDGVVIGLQEHQTDKPSSLFWSLLLPFRRIDTPKHVPKNERQA